MSRKFIALSGIFNSTFAVFIAMDSFSQSPQSLAPQGFYHLASLLRLRVRLSAIMAMNSLLVGLPLILLTV